MTNTQVALTTLRSTRPTHGPMSSVAGRSTFLALAALVDEGRAAGRGEFVTPAELAVIVGLAPSTTARWLRDLSERGFARRVDHRRYTVARRAPEPVTVRGGAL